MLMSYGRPVGITWFTIGVGSAFLSDTAALTDGRPGSVTRFKWSTTAQTTASHVSLHGDWSQAQQLLPGLTAIIGTTLPVGTRVTVAYRQTGFSYSHGFAEGNVIQLPRGERALFLAPGPVAETTCTGVKIDIYNNAGGVATIAAGATLEIGEIWIGRSLDLPIRSDWSTTLEDPTVVRESDSGQPWIQRGVPRRVLTFTPDIRQQSEVFGTGVGALDYETILAKIDRGQQLVCAPRYLTDAGVADTNALTRSAVFGTTFKIGGFRHLKGPLFGPEPISIREAPIPV